MLHPQEVWEGQYSHLHEIVLDREPCQVFFDPEVLKSPAWPLSRYLLILLKAHFCIISLFIQSFLAGGLLLYKMSYLQAIESCTSALVPSCAQM